MKYTNEQIQQIKALHANYLDNLLDIDFDKLSNNQMSFIRCVSLSSIMTMKKHKSNNDIMNSPLPGVSQVSMKDRLATMSDDELAELGLSRM